MLTVALALHLYERSLCQCGHSMLLAHGAEGVGEYEAQTVTCHACKAIARADRSDAPGLKLFTRDLHDDPRDDELDDLDEDGDEDA